MRLDPEREIRPTGQTVGDFWAWAFSDVLSNVNRAVLAEWLVGSALGCVGGIIVARYLPMFKIFELVG